MRQKGHFIVWNHAVSGSLQIHPLLAQYVACLRYSFIAFKVSNASIKWFAQAIETCFCD